MGDHLVSTPATPGVCPRCRSATLTGLAEGCLVHTDAAPVDPATEHQHHADGRQTYTLIAGELVHRDDTRTGPVNVLHVEHRCPPPVPPPYTTQTLF